MINCNGVSQRANLLRARKTFLFVIARAAIARAAIAFAVIACAAIGDGQMNVASARPAGDDQQRLFQQMARQPTNYEVTFAYVRAATANGDYEAAIGALERLVFYNADLPRVKYELGSLYYRLGSYDIAARYFHEALASPKLDAETKRRIEAYLPNAEKQLQQSRLSALVQTGVRYQSNANFGPSGDTVRLGSQDLALLPQSTHRPDGNAYEIVGLSHDYDLDDQRGDTLETRLATYSSQQFQFHDLDVNLFDLSFGPRMPIMSEALPGATLKPYAVGGMTWVGGAPYVSSEGAGLQASLPLAARWTVGPQFEWRHVDYKNSDAATSTFGTGNTFSGGVISNYKVSDQIAFESQAFYRRGTAGFDFQSYNQWTGAVALTFSVAPPIESSPYSWTLTPFGRYSRTEFDAANPYIDPGIVHVDDEWVGGLVINAPLDATLGISATVQYGYTMSTLPNYREKNFSMMVGPTVRF
jgi:hypothetical protein